MGGVRSKVTQKECDRRKTMEFDLGKLMSEDCQLHVPLCGFDESNR